MKEDFLHYVWKFQKFSTRNIKTVQGDTLKIIKTGEQNYNSGPDFLNAQVSVEAQLWAGNVEIHVNSSDWYVHNHEQDPSYDNVILHLVWEHDTEIFREDSNPIPTLELKSIVDVDILSKYQKLFSKKQKWINCENDFPEIDSFIIENWLDRLYLGRLEQKSVLIEKELKASNNHWESVLFRLLCKNFGLKVNGEAFYSIANSLDFSVVKKCSQDAIDLESLLFGQAGFFEETKESVYFVNLERKYLFFKEKFNIKNDFVIFPKFFRLRPPNFPTIRLSQLAVLFTQRHSLFSEIIATENLNDFYLLFNISANEYWDTHYNFGITSVKRQKRLTHKFIDLLLINTLIPLKFCYARYLGKDASQEIIKLAIAIPKEENTIIKKFNQLWPFTKNGLQTQALLQLKNEYCDKNKCLQCVIGNSILKSIP